VLFEGSALLVPSIQQFAGLILGEGPERPRLEALARTRGLRLLPPGCVSDPHPTHAALDVAVLPSRAAGWTAS